MFSKSVGRQYLTVFRIGKVGAATRIPFAAAIAFGGETAGLVQHRGQVHEVVGHEGGVAVGEVVAGAARAGVQVGRAGAGFADPAGIGLRWDGVAEVLHIL